MFHARALASILLSTALFTPACKTEEQAHSQTIEVSVTEDGFVASGNRVKVGQPVTLLVTRKTDRTCATDIAIGEYGVKQALPKDRVVKITFTPTKPGTVRYACGMDMLAGQLVVE